MGIPKYKNYPKSQSSEELAKKRKDEEYLSDKSKVLELRKKITNQLHDEEKIARAVEIIKKLIAN